MRLTDGCPGLDLRGKGPKKRRQYELRLNGQGQTTVGDLEIMIHKERRMNGRLLRRG